MGQEDTVPAHYLTWFHRCSCGLDLLASYWRHILYSEAVVPTEFSHYKSAFLWVGLAVSIRQITSKCTTFLLNQKSGSFSQWSVVRSRQIQFLTLKPQCGTLWAYLIVIIVCRMESQFKFSINWVKSGGTWIHWMVKPGVFLSGPFSWTRSNCDARDASA